MTQELYLNLQLHNIDVAISSAKRALDAARTLQAIFGNKDTDRQDKGSFTKDALRYFDSNDAIKQIEWLQLQIKDLKNKLIEIKIENDKMLLEGGFVQAVDRDIAYVFVHHRLCKLQGLDPATVVALQDVIKTLEQLKDELRAV